MFSVWFPTDSYFLFLFSEEDSGNITSNDTCRPTVFWIFFKESCVNLFLWVNLFNGVWRFNCSVCVALEIYLLPLKVSSVKSSLVWSLLGSPSHLSFNISSNSQALSLSLNANLDVSCVIVSCEWMVGTAVVLFSRSLKWNWRIYLYKKQVYKK